MIDGENIVDDPNGHRACVFEADGGGRSIVGDVDNDIVAVDGRRENARARPDGVLIAEIENDVVAVGRREQINVAEVCAFDGVGTGARSYRNLLAAVEDIIAVAGAADFNRIQTVDDVGIILDGEGLGGLIEDVGGGILESDGADGFAALDRNNKVLVVNRRARDRTAADRETVVDAEVGDQIVAVGSAEQKHLGVIVRTGDGVIARARLNKDVVGGIDDVISAVGTDDLLVGLLIEQIIEAVDPQILGIILELDHVDIGSGVLQQNRRGRIFALLDGDEQILSLRRYRPR